MSGTSGGLGDFEITSLKWGQINLNNADCLLTGIIIREDIFESRGPFCAIVAKDYSDVLGKAKANGSFDEDIEVKIKTSLGSTGLMGSSGKELSFKFKPLQNKNNKDNSSLSQGSGKYKEFTLIGCSEEFLKSQKNYQKSYQDNTSNMVKDILEKGYGTKKKINLSQTEGKVRYVVNNIPPSKALQDLNGEHVSPQYKSSCYVCFQRSGENGSEGEYHFKTFEELFEQSPIAKYSAKTTNVATGANMQDKQYHIINFNVKDAFFTPTRSLTKANETTFNLTTHGVHDRNVKSEKFKLPDKEVYQGQVSYVEQKEVNIKTVNDGSNNKEKRRVGEAKRNRAEFISHLAQNSAEIEIIGNPAIKLGTMIELEIPKRTQDNTAAAGDSQFNGKALVVGIKHKLRPVGAVQPRYTMTLKLIKASFKEGGDNA
jgi:hypothetical protein